MVLQSAHGGHQNGSSRAQARGAGLDVHEFFRAQVCPKAGLGHHPIRVAQRHARGQQRVGSLRNVGKRAAVEDGRIALQGLYQVGTDGVLHQQGHGLVRVQHGRINGLAVPGVAHVNAPHPFL